MSADRDEDVCAPVGGRLAPEIQIPALSPAGEDKKKTVAHRNEDAHVPEGGQLAPNPAQSPAGEDPTRTNKVSKERNQEEEGKPAQNLKT